VGRALGATSRRRGSADPRAGRRYHRRDPLVPL